jgi:hypothetical protein
MTTPLREHARAIRYRQLVLREVDKARTALLNTIADEAERGVLVTSHPNHGPRHPTSHFGTAVRHCLDCFLKLCGTDDAPQQLTRLKPEDDKRLVELIAGGMAPVRAARTYGANLSAQFRRV